MITEERRTILDKESISDYISTCQSTIWPSIRASGGSVLCMLNGMIGSPASHMLQMTSYENTESWQTGQGAWTTDRENLVKEETVRILRPYLPGQRKRSLLKTEDPFMDIEDSSFHRLIFQNLLPARRKEYGPG